LTGDYGVCSYKVAAGITIFDEMTVFVTISGPQGVNFIGSGTFASGIEIVSLEGAILKGNQSLFSFFLDS
jgi:hypothetical protein